MVIALSLNIIYNALKYNLIIKQNAYNCTGEVLEKKFELSLFKGKISPSQ